MNEGLNIGLKNIIQGGLGNYSEVSVEVLTREYGMYLMNNEVITMGFKLVRDALIFTSRRIIMTDKQGTTGSKIRITSINLYSVVGMKVKRTIFILNGKASTRTSSHRAMRYGRKKVLRMISESMKI